MLILKSLWHTVLMSQHRLVQQICGYHHKFKTNPTQPKCSIAKKFHTQVHIYVCQAASNTSVQALNEEQPTIASNTYLS